MKRLSTTTLAQTPLDHPTLIHTELNYTYLSHTTQYTAQTNCNDKTRLYFKEKKSPHPGTTNRTSYHTANSHHESNRALFKSDNGHVVPSQAHLHGNPLQLVLIDPLMFVILQQTAHK